ncbi:MAG: TonB-dependent receptor [Alphaproteobacteria bacterium]|nr:TonB-dependent receptor [Alphaproteobacteria bacterium]
MPKICLFFLAILLVSPAYAKKPLQNDPEFDEILTRDISALTVTSVARRSQQLKNAAAAVYVITQQDLRRAGIYSVPEALRMVPGVQVAKIASDRWAISARGFNHGINNKLLVLIDGRAVYTPVFSGVYWGDQGTTINDIDRIEVIRGPGASIYGANAVNGVINVITKPAFETQGNMVSATATARGRGLYEARHGGKIQNGPYYRNYIQYVDAANWYKGRSGFRMDGDVRNGDHYTLQGDVYGGEHDTMLTTAIATIPYSQTYTSRDKSYGGNVLGRWNHRLARDSEINLQAYVDHYERLESNFEQRVSTADVNLQHNITLDKRNNFIWGMGARLNYQDLNGSFSTSVNDRYDTHHLLSAFMQNEYAIKPDALYLTLGSKFEHNDYTGIEIQPTARMVWHPVDKQTIWGAVSRAVRTPSSIENDVDIVALVNPGIPPTELHIVGNPNQKSEELIAYELGHRVQLTQHFSVDTAVFFNDFSNLQTIGSPGASFIGSNGNPVIPYTLNNLGEGHVYGLEMAALWNVNKNWRLAGSYTYLKMDLEVKPGTANTLEGTEDLAPRNQFAVQSYYNLTNTVQWDNMLYFVDEISAPADSYVRYDTRIAYLAQPGLEFSIIGRNLLGSHTEFPSISNATVDRNIIGQILWRF